MQASEEEQLSLEQLTQTTERAAELERQGFTPTQAMARAEAEVRGHSPELRPAFVSSLRSDPAEGAERQREVNAAYDGQGAELAPVEEVDDAQAVDFARAALECAGTLYTLALDAEAAAHAQELTPAEQRDAAALARAALADAELAHTNARAHLGELRDARNFDLRPGAQRPEAERRAARYQLAHRVTVASRFVIDDARRLLELAEAIQ